MGNMRYSVSGTCTQAVPPNTGTGATGTTTLLSITSGRAFWLRGIQAIGLSGATQVIEIYDATTQSSATTHAIRLSVGLPIAASGANANVVLEFSPPGIKFSNNYVLAKMAGTENIPVGACTIWGYES